MTLGSTRANLARRLAALLGKWDGGFVVTRLKAARLRLLVSRAAFYAPVETAAFDRDDVAEANGVEHLSLSSSVIEVHPAFFFDRLCKREADILHGCVSSRIQVRQIPAFGVGHVDVIVQVK